MRITQQSESPGLFFWDCLETGASSLSAHAPKDQAGGTSSSNDLTGPECVSTTCMSRNQSSHANGKVDRAIAASASRALSAG
jgi:hypothetical protein